VKRLILPAVLTLALIVILPGTGLCAGAYSGAYSSYLKGKTETAPYYDLIAKVDEFSKDKTAATEDMGGKIGIGYDDGISRRYWLTNGQSVEGIVKLQADIISGTTDEFEIRLGGRIHPIVIARTDNMILSAFAGLDIYKHTGIRNFFDEKEAYISACGGLSPEIFIFKNVSVEIPLGVYFQVGGGQEHGSAPYTMISLGTFGEELSLNVGLVFHVYFRP